MRSPLLKNARRGKPALTTAIARVRKSSLAIAGTVLTLVATSSALDAQAGAQTSDWIQIPTRISGITMQFRTLGCKEGLCTIEVDTNIPGGSNYKETINCNTQKIQTVIAGKPSAWLPIDRGSVDEVKFQKVCNNK